MSPSSFITTDSRNSPVLTLPEQQEIVRFLDEPFEGIGRNQREIDGALRSREALRQAILKKAFTGRLFLPYPAPTVPLKRTIGFRI